MASHQAQRTGRHLVAVASVMEASAVLRGVGGACSPPTPWMPVELAFGTDLVVTGVGKVNAAACIARLLPGPYSFVLSLGIGGALPGTGLGLGDSVLATACAYADEGIVTPRGFMDCGEMGFPLASFGGRAVPTSVEFRGRLAAVVTRQGIVATVSTCSGTDGAAREVAARTGAIVEAMEGAAVAHVAWILGVPSAEIRVVSNTTGDRTGQKWDLTAATTELAGVIGRVLACLA